MQRQQPKRIFFFYFFIVWFFTIVRIIALLCLCLCPLFIAIIGISTTKCTSTTTLSIWSASSSSSSSSSSSAGVLVVWALISPTASSSSRSVRLADLRRPAPVLLLSSSFWARTSRRSTTTRTSRTFSYSKGEDEVMNEEEEEEDQQDNNITMVIPPKPLVRTSPLGLGVLVEPQGGSSTRSPPPLGENVADTATDSSSFMLVQQQQRTATTTNSSNLTRCTMMMMKKNTSQQQQQFSFLASSAYDQFLHFINQNTNKNIFLQRQEEHEDKEVYFRSNNNTLSSTDSAADDDDNNNGSDLIQRNNLHTNNNNTIIPINTLIFQIVPSVSYQQQQQPTRTTTNGEDHRYQNNRCYDSSTMDQKNKDEYMVAILPTKERVNIKLLQEQYNHVMDLRRKQQQQKVEQVDDNYSIPYQLILAPRDQLIQICGFESKTIPPVVGFMRDHPPIMTFIESSCCSDLVGDTINNHNSKEEETNNDNIKNIWWVGGGGRYHQSCWVRSKFIVQQPHAYWAQFRQNDEENVIQTKDSSSSSSSSNSSTSTATKNIIIPSTTKATSLSLLQQQVQTNRSSNRKKSKSSSWLPTSLTSTTHLDQQTISACIESLPYFAVGSPPINIVKEILQQQQQTDVNRNNTTNKYKGIDSPMTWIDQNHDSNQTVSSQLQPTLVTIVGQIGSVRRMARRLVFCQLLPPTATSDHVINHNNNNIVNNQHKEDNNKNQNLLVWRCPTTGQPMQVQLIAGKTMSRMAGENGNDDIDKAYRSLKPGLLVLIQGQTNVLSRDSLHNWVSQSCLDIVIHSYQILQPTTPSVLLINNNKKKMEEYNENYINQQEQLIQGSRPLTSTTRRHNNHSNGLHLVQSRRIISTMTTPTTGSTLDIQSVTSEKEVSSHLQIGDIYTGMSPEQVNKRILIVDTVEDIVRFSNTMSDLLLSLTTTAATATTMTSTIASMQQSAGWLPNNRKDDDDLTSHVALIGIDCEWLPGFYSISSSQQHDQVVLLLQISFQSIQQVFLLDLQTLLRPLQSPGTLMNELELAVSNALEELFRSQRLIKVGFQVTQDLRRLAASYPHITAFQHVHAVLEVSTMAKRVIHMINMDNSRIASSSLSRLTEQFLGRTLNKNEQCSDWSRRPLTSDQINYAALDAIVTPALVETLMHRVQARFYADPVLVLGRHQNDPLLINSLTNWRFLFLDQAVATTDQDGVISMVKKMNAKRVVGDLFVVTQSWTTGQPTPRPPSMTVEDHHSIYIDKSGVQCVPTSSISIVPSPDVLDQCMQAIVGQPMGKTKDRCLLSFMHHMNSDTSGYLHGSKLDFPQRSGYVEFADAVALFVNMPSSELGAHQLRRPYPNEWLDGGRKLMWFLRQDDWKHGTTALAQKLVSPRNSVQVQRYVFLFCRDGKQAYVCCGRCGVIEVSNTNEDFSRSGDSDLVRLDLILKDFESLQARTSHTA